MRSNGSDNAVVGCATSARTLPMTQVDSLLLVGLVEAARALEGAEGVRATVVPQVVAHDVVYTAAIPIISTLCPITSTVTSITSTVTAILGTLTPILGTLTPINH